MSIGVGTLLNSQLQGVIAPQIDDTEGKVQVRTFFDTQGAYYFNFPSNFLVGWNNPVPNAGDTISITVTAQNEGVQFFNMLINGMYMPPKTSMNCSGTFFGPAFSGGFMDVSFGPDYVTFVSSSDSLVSMPPALPVIPGLVLQSTGLELPLVFNVTVVTTTPEGTSYSQMSSDIQRIGYPVSQLNKPGCSNFGYEIELSSPTNPGLETITFNIPLNNLSATATGSLTGNIVMSAAVPLPMGVMIYSSNLMLLNNVMLSGGTIQPVALDPTSTFFGSLRANATVSGSVYFCNNVATLNLRITTPLKEIPSDSVWPLIATNLSANINLTFTPSTTF